MFKLCGKEYQSKMSLEAMKQFKQNTGKDLWCLLITMIEVFATTGEVSVLERMRLLYQACDFETASYAFHALCTNNSVPLDEMQDGMFRVGWMPTEREGDITEPWPLILVMLAYDIDKQFNQIPETDKKKVDTSE
jgi:hypothetical protein